MSLRKCGGTGWNNKKLLEREFVTSVFTTINNIEARNGEGLWDWVTGNIGVVLPERNSTCTGSSLGSSKGNCKMFGQEK